MKKINIILMLVILPAITVNAQCPLKRGQYQFNAGIGLSGWGIPVNAGVDFGVFRDITAGLDASFRSYSETIYGFKYTSNVFGIALNGNYHFNTVFEIPRRWDFYAGVSLGYYSWGLPSDYPGTNASGIAPGIQIGGRYFFNKQVGLNLEFGGGGGVAGGKIGVTFTMNQ